MTRLGPCTRWWTQTGMAKSMWKSLSIGHSHLILSCPTENHADSEFIAGTREMQSIAPCFHMRTTLAAGMVAQARTTEILMAGKGAVRTQEGKFHAGMGQHAGTSTTRTIVQDFLIRKR
mmetsp:Transcript_5480/g.10444  ORF Transcript_5480/g.10444 Transcript_5480/m.10444 type:complete len:119 (-) Transcript_5480:793-1149(-)